MREVEFAHATNDQGLMSFRVNLPIERAQEFGKAAADGQMGCVMKLYRDWQLSGDDALLDSLWPQAKKVMEFCWIEGGWDADKDGVMEGGQHNTMDVEYYGPNPQMGIWYLGALRACEAMARHQGDEAFAATCRSLFERGSRWIDENLFNGEYYGHHIRPPKDRSAVAPALLMASYPKERPENPFPYFSEVMTGFEHTAAIGMLQEGQIDEGLECIANIRDRHDGRKRSPFDEAECGHHYARATASWAAVPALTGFQYSGVDRTMTFASDEGQHFWSNGNAWGTCTIKRTGGKADVTLAVMKGQLDLTEFGLESFGAREFDDGLSIREGRQARFEVNGSM